MDVKINVGSGDDYKEGWVNVDKYRCFDPDIVHDCSQGLPFEDRLAERVLVKHFLEHLPFRMVEGFLKECYRVLEKGGLLIIEGPNLGGQVKVLANKEEWTWEDIKMVFGGQEYEGNYHKCGFSPEFLMSLLEEIGFKVKDVTLIGKEKLVMRHEAIKV